MAKAAAEEAWPPSEPSQLAMLPMPKSRPAKAPKSPEMQMAKLDDPDAVPLPQPKPEVEVAAPAREAKPARRASHRHVRSYRKQSETPSLIAFLQKLTTPAKPQRRRR